MSERPAVPASLADVSLADEVARLLRQVQTLLADGAADTLADRTIEELLTIGVKLYVATQQDADAPPPPFASGSVAPGDVILAINHLLRVANVDPFELALWNTWGKA